MTRGRGGSWVRSIQALYNAGSLGGLDDAELLGVFLGRGEASGAAFEALVARHAAMVLGVCRAVAGSEADAEDAFQATFLVLACRASSVRKRSALGPWLFGVSQRLATRARAASARRRKVERHAANLRPDSCGPIEADDAVAALMEEVGRLPARYRDPLVLCFLQGMTYEAASRRLGCPLGTLSIRIRRAKERLRRSLERRGVCEASALAAIPGAAAPKALAASTARLASLVAPALTEAGVPASVLSLTRGALTTMRIQKLAAASIVFFALATGAWAWRASAAIDDPPSQPTAKATTEAKPARYQLTGRVVDEEGRPAEGAVISVRTRDQRLGKAVSKTARSGADGTYTLSLPPGHSDRLWVTPPPGCWPPAHGTLQLHGFALSAKSPTERRDFTFKRGAGWSFRVDSCGNSVDTGVICSEDEVESGSDRAFAVIDAQGRAVLGLPRQQGEVKLYALGGCFNQQKAGGTLRWDDQFRPDSVRTVERLDGEPSRYRATDRDGRSAIIEAAPGDQLKPEIEDGRLVIHVILPEDPRETLPVVVGKVVDGDGKPIPRARIQGVYYVGVIPVIANEEFAATTDESGRFRLENIPARCWGERPKSVDLIVTHDEYAAVTTTAITIDGGGPVTAPPIVMAPGCTISGVVLHPNGKPVEGAQVVHNGTSAAVFRPIWTDVDGRFTLAGLAEGDISLVITYGPWKGEPSQFTARRSPQSVEIRLQ